MSRVFLKLHRWLGLIFALPLVIVLGTGLILSFEPSFVVGSIKPGALTAAKVETLLARHDPQGRARALIHRSYDGSVTISMGGRGGTTVDASSGEKRAGPGWLAGFLLSNRLLHEHFVFEMRWMVTASSIAMLVLAVLGVLQGWPRFSNSLSGWHKGVGWVLIPLVVLSPLTGLFIATGVSLAGPAPMAPEGPPLKLVEAVRVVGKSHDLSGLVWLRPRGDRLLARIVENGEFRVYQVSSRGTEPMPRNWPRLLHEGNFAGHFSALLNVITSLALIGLLVTGAWIWVKRQMRRRARRASMA